MIVKSTKKKLHTYLQRAHSDWLRFLCDARCIASFLRNSKSPVVSLDNGRQAQTCLKRAYFFPECLETGWFRVEFFRAAANAYLIDLDALLCKDRSCDRVYTFMFIEVHKLFISWLMYLVYMLYTYLLSFLFSDFGQALNYSKKSNRFISLYQP